VGRRSCTIDKKEVIKTPKEVSRGPTKTAGHLLTYLLSLLSTQSTRNPGNSNASRVYQFKPEEPPPARGREPKRKETELRDSRRTWGHKNLEERGTNKPEESTNGPVHAIIIIIIFITASQLLGAN